MKQTNRRAVLAALAAGALPLGARAQGANDLKGTTVVFASWGGAYQEAEKASYCEPFEKATGAKVVQDGPMNVAKFRAMAASGTPDWDVVDVTGAFLEVAIKDGLLEKIDTRLVNVGRIDPRFVSDHGVGCIVWSYNLGFSTTAFPNGAPRVWADLFDLRKFPGKRTLLDQPVASLEVALLADGVAPDKLYPLDVERAFRKLEAIKKQTVFWSTNSQSQQLFVDREVVAGIILNGRVYDAAQKGAKIALSWEQNIQAVDYLVVPKGSRNRDAAMRLIDTMTVAENQTRVANMIAYSPTNLAGLKGIDPKIEPWLCTTPDNLKKGLVINQAYWRDNLAGLTERWTAWKLA
jgi:putative spermidine/putrescine transport system substrate-binding protein